MTVDLTKHEAETLIDLLNRTRMSDEVIEILRKLEIGLGFWE